MLALVKVVLEGEPTPMESIITALTTAFTSAVSSVMSAIASILPIILPVAGAMVVISVGYRLFKCFTK